MVNCRRPAGRPERRSDLMSRPSHASFFLEKGCRGFNGGATLGCPPRLSSALTKRRVRRSRPKAREENVLPTSSLRLTARVVWNNYGSICDSTKRRLVGAERIGGPSGKPRAHTLCWGMMRRKVIPQASFSAGQTISAMNREWREAIEGRPPRAEEQQKKQFVRSPYVDPLFRRWACSTVHLCTSASQGSLPGQGA